MWVNSYDLYYTTQLIPKQDLHNLKLVLMTQAFR